MAKTTPAIHALLITREKELVERVTQDLSLVQGYSFTLLHLQRLTEAPAQISKGADVVLLDLDLEDSSGWATLEQGYGLLPAAPIVVLGRDKKLSAIEEAIRLGAQDYLLVDALTQRLLVTAIVGAVGREQLLVQDSIGDVINQAADEWRATFDAVEDYIVVLNKDRRVLRANAAAEELFGAGALYNQPCHYLFHGTEEPMDGCPISRAFNLGEAGHLEFREEHLDGRWFNISAYPIKSADGTVERAVHVMRDITEAHNSAHYQRILDAKKLVLTELEELNEMKSQFIEVSAHEMRTPMTVIRSGVDLLKGGTMGELNERQQEFLSVIARNIDRLSRFSGDVLSLARLDAGRYRLKCTQLNLRQSLEATMMLLKETANDKNIQVEWSCPDEEGLEVHADPDALSQVVFNLISNAIMHCPHNTTVEVKAEPLSSPEVQFSVSDNGPGIPEHELPRIFDRFYQVDRKDGPGYGGTGIGLSISKALVGKMGGNLSVTSQEGEGTTFSFTLPTSERPKEILFGRIAQSMGYVRSEQVQNIVAAQMTHRVDKKIGQIMIDAGLLNQTQVDAILSYQERALGQPHSRLSSTVGESLLGRVALTQGYITEEQLFECVALQSSRQEEGRLVRLGQILLEKEYMTVEDIVMVLHLQKKEMVACPGCSCSFTVPHLKDQGALCPRCGIPLVPSKSPEDAAAESDTED